MDVVLDYCDERFFTPYVYPETWAPGDLWRQFISLNVIVNTGGALLYLITASLSYFLVYDKRLLQHPQILPNQIQREITYTLKSIPVMGVLTVIMFQLEVNGYSKLYDNVHDSRYGWWTIVATVIPFILFTDCLIYWIHRWLHHKAIYKYIHKDHHTWKVPTPYASHAFHPIDGFLQSVPYHFYVFLFPMHKICYILLYIGVNIWTVSIHDGDYRVPDLLRPLVNGSAHHMDHHLFYNYNYGQYFTLWDRIGGSFRNPSSYEGKGPLDLVIGEQKEKSGKIATGKQGSVNRRSPKKIR